MLGDEVASLSKFAESRQYVERVFTLDIVRDLKLVNLSLLSLHDFVGVHDLSDFVLIEILNIVDVVLNLSLTSEVPDLLLLGLLVLVLLEDETLSGLTEGLHTLLLLSGNQLLSTSLSFFFCSNQLLKIVILVFLNEGVKEDSQEQV